MIEFKNTGLPADAEVFKAFSTWRSNAQDFAERSGLSADFPVKVAQAIHAASPGDTTLLKLAMLMSVPPAAYGVLEKRFGADTVDTLNEAWTHVRTGYAYAGEASENVKALALAAAAVSFETFTRNAEMTAQTVMSGVQMGKDPAELIRSLLGGDSQRYERLGEVVQGTAHPALEALFAEKLDAYNIAREEQKEQLTALGVVIEDEEADAAGIKAGVLPFESTGLPDDPEVRAAYALVASHLRVTPENFSDALAAGRMLAEAGDPVTVAAGIVDAGVRDLTADDFAFLRKKLGPQVLDIIENYNLTQDFLMAPERIAESPREVQQMALARGILMLDHAKEQSGDLLKRIEGLAGHVSPEVSEQLKEQSLQPARVVSEIIPVALAPVFGNTGAPGLEKLFAQHMQALDEFIAAQTPAADAPAVLRTRRRPGSGPGLQR